MGFNCYGKNLVLAATAFAMELSRGMSADEINILSAFLTVVGDQLALIAATEVARSEENSESKKEKKSAASSPRHTDPKPRSKGI